jgi:hypothetical protein
MATTDLDGKNLMLLKEGNKIAIVLGDKSYIGTLQMRREGIQEIWYIALNDGREMEIHGLYEPGGTVTITEPKNEAGN